MKKVFIGFLLFFSSYVISAPYSYEEVLKRHEELKPIAQQVVVLSEALVSKMDQAMVEYYEGNIELWRALNKDANSLKERAVILGDHFTEPYSYCFILSLSTDSYWLAKKSADTMPFFAQNYQQSLSDCKASIREKPMDNSDLAIIEF